MGYTHEWHINPKVTESDPRWEDVREDVRLLVRYAEVEISGDDEETGFTRPPRDTKEYYLCNGFADMAHDSFLLPLDCHDTDAAGMQWGFCKTDRKPYDQVVCASLMSVKHHFGAEVEITSDGNVNTDWAIGPDREVGSPIALYARVFPERQIPEDLLRGQSLDPENMRRYPAGVVLMRALQGRMPIDLSPFTE